GTEVVDSSRKPSRQERVVTQPPAPQSSAGQPAPSRVSSSQIAQVNDTRPSQRVVADIRDVLFVDGNIGVAAIGGGGRTSGSTTSGYMEGSGGLARTIDGGAHWTQVFTQRAGEVT